MLRCTLELTVRYGLVRRGSSDSKHALQVPTGCVAARGGYHRAERPSIRGQQLVQLARVCLCTMLRCSYNGGRDVVALYRQTVGRRIVPPP